VEEWLKDLGTEEVQKYFGPDGKDIVETIKKNETLLNYFSILVEWVNANPQVLNPEEAKYSCYKSAYPASDSSFSTYEYLNPYRSAYVRLSRLCDGTDRLKQSITNSLAGARGYAMMANIASSAPVGLEMPLNRGAFTYPYQQFGAGNMVGGIGEIESELQKIQNAYGYGLFTEIYSNLIRIMSDLKTPVNGKPGCDMRLSEASRASIEAKLTKFKDVEDAFRKSLMSLIERVRLYQGSRGHIAALEDEKIPGIPDANLQEVLTKHSNLLGLSAAYNKKSGGLLNVFQGLIKVMMEKVGQMETKATSTAAAVTGRRPLLFEYNR